MGVSVAEYLGQRTDIDEPTIEPANPRSLCPFTGRVCEKIIKKNRPVCSIRNYGKKKTIPTEQLRDHPIWIVCPHRLCSTYIKNPGGNLSLTDYQNNKLKSIAEIVFETDIPLKSVFIKSEVKVKVNSNKKQDMSADYILRYEPERGNYMGKKT